MKTKLLIILFLLLGGGSLYSQSFSIDTLDRVIYKYNNALEYEKSIRLLSDLIADPKYSAYDRYVFYLLKSYTYKRLFSYPRALYNLDEALKEGLKSDKKDLVRQSVKAEKSLVYFDMQEFDKAEKLMNELSLTGYRHLEPNIKSFILLQEALLLIKKQQYESAEKKLDYAITVAEEQDLPLFYGKKIELYNAMKRPDLRDRALEEGYAIAQKYGIIKYQMHLYEIAKSEFQKTDEYAKAFEAQKKFDSLAAIYNSTDKVGKLEVLDNALETKRKEEELKRYKRLQYLFLCISVLLLAFFVKVWFTKKHKRKPPEETPVPDISRHNLTPRQLEIIALVRQGKSNKEISAELFISENTVKYHLKVIFEILGIDNRNQLI